MKAKNLFPFAVFPLAGSAAALPAGQTGPAQDEWQNTEDYSRADLFQEHIVAKAPPPTPKERSKALDGPFAFPGNAEKDGGHDRVDSIFGVDVSHWSSRDSNCRAQVDPRTDVDFSTFGGQRIRFVYVKATQDVRYRDCRFSEYWSALGALTSKTRPLRGAYHFLTAISSGAEQAASYIKFRNQQAPFTRDELPSVVDLEWDKTNTNPDRWVGVNNDKIVASVIAWLTAVEAASGKKPLIYTCNAWLKEHHFTMAQIMRLKSYGLWIADYSNSHRAIEVPSQPSVFTLALWQFTAGAKLKFGSPKPLDASIFKGSEAKFAQFMQL